MGIDEENRYATEDVNKHISIEIQAVVWDLYMKMVMAKELDEKIKQPLIIKRDINRQVKLGKNQSVKYKIEVPNAVGKENTFSIHSDINLKHYHDIVTLAIVKSNDIYVLCYDNENLSDYGID